MLHSIKHGMRQLIVVGDRVLVKPEDPDERTEIGLYLPQTVVEKEKVLSGRIMAMGPGIALPDSDFEESEEPWKHVERRTRYIPMQSQEGDYAVFLKKAAIDIKFDGENYLVVPQAAILVLLRDIHEDS